MTQPITEKKQIHTLLEEAYASRVNNLKSSISLALQALELSRNTHDELLEGRSLNQLSLFYMIQGGYDHAVQYAQDAISIFKKLNDDKGLADAKYNLAGVYYKSDNYHLGLTYLIDCLSIYNKFEDYHNLSRTHKSLGTIYEYFGDQNSALLSYENAIEAARKTGDPNLEANAYNNLSGLYLKQNRVHDARDIIDRSVAIKELTGDTRGLAFALYGRGKVNARMQRWQEAERDYLEAMRIHREMGEKLGLGMAYAKLAALYIETGRLADGKNMAREGLEFSNQYNIFNTKFKCDYLLYKIYKLENNHAVALEYLEKYQEDKEAVINTQTLKVIENYELITRMRTMEQDAENQRERADILEKKNRAEESARVRQEFLSTMSHEIRTPLNAITTIISLLGDKVEGEEKQLLDSLKFASNNLLRIINDILDFTKLDSGKTQLELHPVHFKNLLENIWRTYDSMAREKGLKLSLKTDVALQENYEIDETKLGQILGNLVSNSIKFTDKGRVEIEIEKTGGDQQHDKMLFKITDTGEGISENDQELIFESFSQTKPVTTRKQGGTGLGLAIVKKLVALMGGEIKVQSSLGHGSQFYFELGLKKVIKAEKPEENQYVKLNGKHALIAEDNDINAFVIKKLLTKWGVSADHAVNGREALEKSTGRVYDFILMDIHMPEMNGYDAAKGIRKQGNPNLTTPLFALTADITAPSADEYHAYFNGFLWKPLQIEKLYEALSETAVRG